MTREDIIKKGNRKGAMTEGMPMRGNVCCLCGQPASHTIIENAMDLIGDWRLYCPSHYEQEASKEHYSAFVISDRVNIASKDMTQKTGLYRPLVCQTEG